MTKAFRLRALERATRYIGVKEDPPNSNHGKLIDQWCYTTNGIPGGYPWCAAFMYCMFRAVGNDLKKTGLKQPAWVESWVSLAHERGWVVSRPLRGDVCCFDWDSDRLRDHIGIVERVLALRWRGGKFVGWVRSIEGNTSTQQNTTGSQSNGGCVARRWRWVNGSQVYVRIPGP